MTSYMAIASNSSGVVEKVMVNEGEYVHDWEPLFLIKSSSGTVNKVELGLSGFISNVKVKRGDQVISNMTLAITIIDLSAERLRQLDDIFGNQIKTLMSNPLNIAEAVAEADLLIGAVLIPGAKAPKLVTEEMIKAMKPGSVVVDVAIDQGGIVETVDRITTHDNPIYEKYDVVHYAVANMPGAVSRTSTIGITNVTVPYALQIANKGVSQAISDNHSLKSGLNVANGEITYEDVAKDLGYNFVSPDKVFEKVPTA